MDLFSDEENGELIDEYEKRLDGNDDEVQQEIQENADPDNPPEAGPTDGSAETKPERKKTVRTSLSNLKLDGERLCGPVGLSHLKMYFENIHYKGKGYELEDLVNIMGRIELWAHRLFPKHKFENCLEHIAKLGQQKSVQAHANKLRMGMNVLHEQFQEDAALNVDEEDDVLRNDTREDPFDQLHPQSQPTVCTQEEFPDENEFGDSDDGHNEHHRDVNVKDFSNQYKSQRIESPHEVADENAHNDIIMSGNVESEVINRAQTDEMNGKSDARTSEDNLPQSCDDDHSVEELQDKNDSEFEKEECLDNNRKEVENGKEDVKGQGSVETDELVEENVETELQIDEDSDEKIENNECMDKNGQKTDNNEDNIGMVVVNKVSAEIVEDISEKHEVEEAEQDVQKTIGSGKRLREYSGTDIPQKSKHRKSENVEQETVSTVPVSNSIDTGDLWDNDIDDSDLYTSINEAERNDKETFSEDQLLDMI